MISGKIHLILLFSLFSILNLYPQQLTVYNHQNTGLPKDDLASIAKDYNNNLWLGVSPYGPPSGGLVKYKDSVMTIYYRHNSNLSCDIVHSIAVDLDNSLWLGVTGGDTYKYGVYHFINNIVEFYDYQNSPLPENREVTFIYIDKLGNKWFAPGGIFTGNGLVKFDGTTWSTIDTSNSPLPTNNVSGIIQDSAGVYWIGLRKDHEGTIEGGGLVRYDGINFQIYNKNNSSIPSNNIEALTYHKHNIWLNTLDSGIVKFDGQNFTTFPIENYNGNIYDRKTIYVDDLDRVWIDTYFLDGDTTIHVNDIFDDEIYHVYKYLDYENELWMLTWNGIYIYNNVGWKKLNSYNTGISNSNINSFSIDNENNLAVGTARSYCLFRNTIWLNYNDENTPMPFYPDIFCVEYDQEAKTYLGTRYGLWIYDGMNWINYNTQNSGLPYPVVKDIKKDSNNVLWISTLGLAKFTEPNQWEVYNTSNSVLTSNDIKEIFIDSQNRMWAILRDPNGYGGIVVNTNSGLVLFNQSTPGILTNVFNTIAEDLNNQICVGAKDGFYKYNGTVWQKVTTGNLAGIDSINIIKFNPQGEMWFVAGWFSLYKLTSNDELIQFPISHPEITDYYIQDLVVGQDNKVYLLTFGDVIILKDDSTANVVENSLTEIKDYKLFNNYPNPFNPTTTIKFDLRREGLVTLEIFDILGRRIATLINENRSAGSYEQVFNASSLSSGVYIYKLHSGDFTASNKLILLR